MAGYRRLSEAQERIHIGFTKQLLEAGKTPEYIAKELKRPISEVNRWVDMINKAKELRKKT